MTSGPGCLKAENSENCKEHGSDVMVFESFSQYVISADAADDRVVVVAKAASGGQVQVLHHLPNLFGIVFRFHYLFALRCLMLWNTGTSLEYVELALLRSASHSARCQSLRGVREHISDQEACAFALGSMDEN